MRAVYQGAWKSGSTNHFTYGANGIGVAFHAAGAAKSGYVVKQFGTNTFFVTDGTTTNGNLNTWKVRLAQTPSLAGALTDGYCTILAGSEHVSRIWSRRLRTAEGTTHKWSVGSSVNGSLALARYVPPTHLSRKAESKPVNVIPPVVGLPMAELPSEPAKLNAKPKAD